MKRDRDLPGTARALASVGRERTRERTSDRVYEELASAICELRIPPGASLSETDLAGQLHVSRTVLREALARLVDIGLVSVVPQVGTRVELIRLHHVEQARFVRQSLEGAAFAAACAKPRRDVGLLRDLLAEQQRCHDRGDIDGFFAADEALHQQIFVAGGYPGAWQLMQSMKMHLNRLRRLSLPEPATVQELIREHTSIVDALQAGDAAGGNGHLVRHARRVLETGPALQAQYPEYFTT